MQKRVCFLLITVLITCCSYAQLAFKISNPIAVERNDELIMLKRTDIEKSLDERITSGYIMLQSGGKDQLFQYVDADNDKQWDTIIFLCSFKPNETKAFTLEVHKPGSTYGTAPVHRAHVRMKPIKPDSSFGESVTYAEMPYQNPPTDFSKH